MPVVAEVCKDKSTLVLEERASLIDIAELEASPPKLPLLTPAIKHDDGNNSSLQVHTVASRPAMGYRRYRVQFVHRV